jgi:hypothetical protein
MELQHAPDKRQAEILPVVRYSVQRKIAKGKPDYWDYATLVELAVLGKDEEEARTMLPKAYACIRESWEPGTTARNLRLIRESRERQGKHPAWASDIEQVLLKRADQCELSAELRNLPVQASE